MNKTKAILLLITLSFATLIQPMEQPGRLDPNNNNTNHGQADNNDAGNFDLMLSGEPLPELDLPEFDLDDLVQGEQSSGEISIPGPGIPPLSLLSYNDNNTGGFDLMLSGGASPESEEGVNSLASQADSTNQKNPGEKFKCDHEGCSYATACRRNFARHKLKHTGEKPYKCDHPDCDYATAYSFVLAKHKLTKHTDGYKVEKSYKCDNKGCTHASARKGNLIRHQRDKHFICCNQTFESRDEVNKHYEQKHKHPTKKRKLS